MNRRQFLGRVFQSMISLHNSNNLKYIYHPWRQYRVSYEVKITFKIKNGKDTEGNTTYSNLTSTQKGQTVVGVFDEEGNLVYCSAYYRSYNGSLYNRFSDTINLALPAGNYTIQCLQYGIGVGEGESGNIMTFTVPECDRTKLENNNYGYISNPALSIDYIFGYAGVVLSANVTIVDVGKTNIINNNLFDVYSEMVIAPTYDECKTACEAAAKSIDIENYEYTNGMYMETILRNIGDNAHVTIQGADKYDGPIYYSYPTLNLSYTDGVSEEPITSVNFAGYIGDSSDYWLACYQNDLEYDMELQDKYTTNKPDNQTYRFAGCELTGTSGSFTNYYADNVANLVFSNPDVLGNLGDYVDSNGNNIGVGASASASPKRYKNVKVKNVSLYLGNTSGKKTIYDRTGTSASYSYSKPYLRISWECEGEIRKSSSYTSINAPENASSVSELISKKIANANKASAAVWDKYNANTEYNTTSFNGRIDHYPLAALFGKIPEGKTLCWHYTPPAPSGKQFEVVVNESRKTVGVKWNRPWAQTTETRSNRYLRPMLDKYLADLSEYDPDNAFGNTRYNWVGISDDGSGYTNKYIFLRQSIVPVNIEAIPTK